MKIEELLTPRQLQIIELIALGMGTKEIAFALSTEQQPLSSKTVEYHRASICYQLDIHDVALLTHFAIYHGIVPLVKQPMPKEKKSYRKCDPKTRIPFTCGVKHIPHSFNEAA